jgi:DNA polymerase II small subunit
MHATITERKKHIVTQLMKKGILLNAEVLSSITEQDTFDTVLERISIPGRVVVDNEVQTKAAVNWAELERMRVVQEKGRGTDIPTFPLELTPTHDTNVTVVMSYNEENTKREVQDFVDYFNHRFKAIEKVLKSRQGLQSNVSVKHLLKRREKEQATLIGMLLSKEQTKRGHLMLTLEDPTGTIKALISKDKPELFRRAEGLVLDEVIGVVGVSGENIVFVNDFYFPDVPNQELRKSPEKGYAAFLSDIHVGSAKFLPDDFGRFLKWINGEAGNERQREIASKVKYLFITGDLVDGVGIYPGQEDELDIKDIYAQYAECATLLKQIPSRIKLIICPGNHDAVRLAEPQPVFPRSYCAPLYELSNATIVSNPALVNIHSSNEFQGFNVLMYHGYSFDHFVAEVNSLRNQGGYDRADLIMKFLLQRRHLAPTHTSTQYIPDNAKDPLVIDTIPDFFISGHIHKSVSANYRGITLICGSCWQSKTTFQEKVGHHPEPSRVPVVNLNTREIKILKFGGT